MIWRARVRDVRRREGGVRWTVLAWTPDLETLVYVDTTLAGTVLSLQSDEYVGTTGDLELDDLVCERVAHALAMRHTLQRLDAVDRRRWGRVQQPCDRMRA